MRTDLKKIVSPSLWPYFRAIDKSIIHGMYVLYALKRYFTKQVLFHNHPVLQSVPLIHSNIQFGRSITTACLKNTLEEAGCCDVKSGRHSVYLSQPKDIAQLCPELLTRYPLHFGLKIIKSRQVSSDCSVYYTSAELAPASTRFSMYAVGSVREKTVISNLLGAQSVAPLVYDLVKLESSDGGWQYAMIVEHVQGETLTGNEAERFVERFKKVLEKIGLTTVSIKEHVDLRPPLFRNNVVITPTGHIYYVDIQNFTLLNKRFSRQVFRRLKERYQDSLQNSPVSLLIGSRAEQRKAFSQLQAEQKTLSAFLHQKQIRIDHYFAFDRSNSCSMYLLWMLHFGSRFCWLETQNKQLLKSFYTLLGYSRFEVIDTDDLLPAMSTTPQDYKNILFFNAATVLATRDWSLSMQLGDVVVIETANGCAVIPKPVERQLSKRFNHLASYSFASNGAENITWHFYSGT